MNEVCAFMFHKYPLESPIPYLIEYKMNFLLKNTFWHEFFAIFSPTSFEIDLYKLMKTRDCGVYTSYFLPCGIHGRCLKTLKKSHLGFGQPTQAKHGNIQKIYLKIFRKNWLKCMQTQYNVKSYWCDYRCFKDIWHMLLNGPI